MELYLKTLWPQSRQYRIIYVWWSPALKLLLIWCWEIKWKIFLSEGLHHGQSGSPGWSNFSKIVSWRLLCSNWQGVKVNFYLHIISTPSYAYWQGQVSTSLLSAQHSFLSVCDRELSKFSNKENFNQHNRHSRSCRCSLKFSLCYILGNLWVLSR